MALLFLESFDHHVTADLLLKWTSQNSGGSSAGINAGTGRRSSAAYQMGQDTWGLNKSLTVSGTTFIGGCAYKASLISANTPCIIACCDGGVGTNLNGAQVSLHVKSDGKLEVRRGGFYGTVLGTSSSTVLTIDTYIYLEMKVVVHNSAGTVDVRADGVLIPGLSALTGLDTQQSASTQWTMATFGHGGTSSTSMTVSFDDIYVCDGSGSDNNDFLGDIRVDVQFPNANGNSSMSTPSTGTDRYATVDEAAPNSDTDYNTLAAANDKDTLGVQSLVATGQAILGIQILAYSKKTNAGTATMASVTRHSTTDYDGATVAVGTTYNYVVRQVYDTNPGTSAQWTEADFNAAEFGYKRIA
jgi:hypothetical protein